MKQSNGTEMFAELVKLRNQTGGMHYARIRLASELLADKAWVESPEGGGGDENKAIDRLEQECFADICGAVSLPQMLEVYRHFPDLDKWIKNKFNLGRMWKDYQAKKHPTPKKAKGVYHPAREFVEPLSFSELTNAEKRNEYQRVYRALETKDQKIVRLETENAQLRQELNRIKGVVGRVAV